MTAMGQAPGFDLSNYGVTVEPDKRLIVVLSALEMAQTKNAAGTDEKLINTPLSEKGLAFRARLLQDNAGLNDDLRRRISVFVTQYKKQHPNRSDSEITAPFMSMAYALSPVPELADPLVTSDLPGSLLDVLDFAPLVREFYRRSTISSRMVDYVKEYREDSEGALRRSAREMVSELLGYLHTRPRLVIQEKVKTNLPKNKKKAGALQQVETVEHERRFVLVPEKLAPKGAITFLNIRDDYYVIVPPDTDISFSEARRAFLQFVVDPLVLANTKEMAAIREWAKPVLDARRKADPGVSPDVHLAVSRSLVAAIDVRQAEYVRLNIATDQARQRIGRVQTDAEKRTISAELDKFKQSQSDEAMQQLYEDHQRGAILSFYFAEQLKGIEDSGFDIAASLREMLASFDPTKETDRAAFTAEARKRAVAAREERKRHRDTRSAVIENPVTTRLLEIQKTIDGKDYARATVDLKQLLAKNPGESRIYYNLGRVAGLAAVGIEDEDAQAAKLVEAKAYYENVLRSATGSTDRALLSLTYVALGRIYEHFNDNAYAIRLYDQAIKLDDVAGGGYKEALDAKARLVKPQ
ncbi:MAG: hypothetical protein ABR530_03840 [Pyrinomonadaceae bacterium]